MEHDDDRIYEILKAVEDSGQLTVPQSDLLAALGIDKGNENYQEQIDEFAYYMRTIKDRGLLSSSDENFGFAKQFGPTTPMPNTTYELTDEGRKSINLPSPDAFKFPDSD